jgi:hypothetical protein
MVTMVNFRSHKVQVSLAYFVGTSIALCIACRARQVFLEVGKIPRKGGEFIMKARVMTLPLLLFVSFLGSSCSTMNRLNTEYEEETTRVEQQTPQEQHENFMIDMRGYFGDGD